MRAINSLWSGLPGTIAASPDFPPFQRSLARVEPQFGLARLLILPVACKTVIRKDRFNIAIILRRRSRCRRAKRNADRQRTECNPDKSQLHECPIDK
jgi:hypothetical protein